MATLDEELRMDAEEDAREADFILSQLPSDLKERFTKEEILRLMDLIVEYYYESGVLDLDDDEIEIDLEQVADAICKKAKKKGWATIKPTRYSSLSRLIWTIRSRPSKR